jgi:hypothetical protein
MTERFTGLAGMWIVMEDAAAVSHERGCSTLPVVLREMTLLANLSLPPSLIQPGC